MQLLSVLNNTLKISYNPQDCDLFIGDMLEFVMPNNNGVVAQVFKLEMDETSNIAHLRIFFTIKEGNWIKWVGNIPPKSSDIKKIAEEEVLELFSQYSENSVAVGFLPQYGRNFRVKTDNLEKTFLLFDNDQNKVDIFENFRKEFAKKGQSFVIFDFKGDFKEAKIPTIKAIKDFKIPLNIDTLLSMYEKNFQYSSVEMKLLFDDVISQIKVFFQKSDEIFVPFNIFKSVVDNASPSIELSLLRNILEKYKEKELFANLKSDFSKMKNIFQKSTAYIVDMSCVPQEWQKDYILFVLECLDKSFVLLEDNKIFKSSKDIDQVFEKNKTLKFITAVNYSSDLLGEFVKRAHNLILAQPNKRINYFPNLVEYLSLLSQEEFIYQGEQSKNIPIMLQPAVEKEDKKTLLKPESKPAVQSKEKKEEVVFEKIKPQKVEPVIQPKEELLEPIQSDEDMIEFEEISLDDLDSLEDIEELSANYTYDEPDEIQEYEEIEFFEEPQELHLEDETLLADVDNMYEEIPSATIEPTPSVQEPISTEPNEPEAHQKPSVPVKKPVYEKQEELQEYKVPKKEIKNPKKFEKEDTIIHPKYGRGIIKRVVSHGERNLYKIQFDENGIKLIDLDTIEVQKL